MQSCKEQLQRRWFGTEKWERVPFTIARLQKITDDHEDFEKSFEVLQALQRENGLVFTCNREVYRLV